MSSVRLRYPRALYLQSEHETLHWESSQWVKGLPTARCPQSEGQILYKTGLAHVYCSMHSSRPPSALQALPVGPLPLC